MQLDHPYNAKTQRRVQFCLFLDCGLQLKRLIGLSFEVAVFIRVRVILTVRNC